MELTSELKEESRKLEKLFKFLPPKVKVCFIDEGLDPKSLGKINYQTLKNKWYDYRYNYLNEDKERYIKSEEYLRELEKILRGGLN